MGPDSARHVPKGSGGPYHRPVDFSWTTEQVELRVRARKVAQEAVARYGRHNDAWINGFSREFSRNWRRTAGSG